MLVCPDYQYLLQEFTGRPDQFESHKFENTGVKFASRIDGNTDRRVIVQDIEIPANETNSTARTDQDFYLHTPNVVVPHTDDWELQFTMPNTD